MIYCLKHTIQYQLIEIYFTNGKSKEIIISVRIPYIDIEISTSFSYIKIFLVQT